AERSALALPVLEEDVLDLRDGGAADPDVRVAPAALRRSLGRGLGMGVVDVDAARERDTAVDDQELSVVALRDPPELRLLERVDRGVLVHLHAGLLERLAERRPDREAADAVVHHAYVDARARACDQRIAVSATHRVVR